MNTSSVDTMVNASHYNTETVFDYSWKQVVQAYWNRYPNPSSAHVLTEDTIAREVRDGILYSRRILSKTNHVPKWAERFYKNTPVKIIEDSVLDPKMKTLITFTRNIGFQKIMKVDEIVEYKEQNDGRTVAVRRAYISSQVFGFSRAIRAFGIERFKSNCQKTVKGFNGVLIRMFPNQKHIPTNGNKTMEAVEDFNSTVVAKSSSTSSSFDHHHKHSSNTTETLKKYCKIGYGYLKAQAYKISQMFSVKN